VDGFFKQSYKFKMQGNDKDSKEYAARALRLQGSLTKTKPMYVTYLNLLTINREIERKQDEGLPKRGDFFNLKVFRKDESDKFLDKSSTFKFKR